MTNQPETCPGDFECVEPEIGAQMWQRDDPSVDSELRVLLADHLSICQACQLEALVNNRIATGLQTGEFQLDGGAATAKPVDLAPGNRWRPQAIVALSSSLALAASLVLMFSLPPASRIPDELLRGDGAETGFLSPVEGEILTTGTPELHWAAVSGATAYTIEISQVDEAWAWTGQSNQASLTVPTDASLPNAGHFRVLVQPIPRDLAGIVDISVYFQRSGPGEFFTYRLGASPLWVQMISWLGLAGLGWVLFSLTQLRRRRV